MAVTVNKTIKQQDGGRGNTPVAASTHIYQGTLTFFNSSGYLVGIVAAGANVFAGMATAEVDNSGGASGDLNAEYFTDGDFSMIGTGFTQATVGLDIFASDNYTVTTSNSSTSLVGRCVGYVSATEIIVKITKQGPQSVLAGTATGTTAATFTVDTDVGKPRAGLMSQTGGTGDFTGFINAPSTLTADRIYTLPADSAQTLVGATATQTLSNKTLTAPVIGVATGTSLAVTGLLTSSSPTAGIGYATGAGGAVSQATDRTTGVTLNTASGAITTQATSLAAGAEVSFTVTNSACAVGDVVVASIRSGPTTTGSTQVYVHTVAAGSFGLTLANLHASVADTGAAIINFCIIKAVSA